MQPVRPRPRRQLLSNFLDTLSRPSRITVRHRTPLFVEGMEDRILMAANPNDALNLINNNGSGDDAATVLNKNQAFQTNLFGSGDVTITPSGTATADDYEFTTNIASFPKAAANSSNNPSWISGFVGSPSLGTGNGNTGTWDALTSKNGDEFTITFSPSQPLVPGDELVIEDIDVGVTLTMTASGTTTGSGTTVPLSMKDWSENAYSGDTGMIPPTGGGTGGWAKWTQSGTNDTIGKLESLQSDDQLSEPLNVLSPAAGQSVTSMTFDDSGGGVIRYQIVVPGPSFTAVSGTGIFGGSAALTATLLNNAGTPLANEPVSFELPNPETGVEEVVGTPTTNASGVANLSNVSLVGFPAGISPDAFLAVFAGDASNTVTGANGNVTSDLVANPNTAINLTNSSGNFDDFLNNNETFQTSLLGDGDVTIQQTASDPNNEYSISTNDNFQTAAASGNPNNNNPTDLTSFVGNPAQGTGDGTPGSMYSLVADDGSDSSQVNSFQINFNTAPIGPSSEILLGDIDGNETVTIQAFDGTQPVSLSNWIEQDLTGENNSYTDASGTLQTDVTPSSAAWADWNVSSDGYTGAFITPTSANLNDEINELTPSQNVTELTFTETGTGGVNYQIITPGSSLGAVSGAGTYGGRATLTSTLLSVAGTPLANELVSFDLMEGGTPTFVGTGTTNANGVATLNNVSLADFSAGTASGAVMAVFAGDATDSPTTAYGDLDVSPAPLTVTANPQSNQYGLAIPNLTYTVSGFVNGDTASVLSGAASLTTTATPASSVGTYPISVAIGTLTAANYVFPPADLIGNTLTVTQAPLTVTANNQMKVYGGTDPALTYSITGTFYNNDGPSVVSGVSLSTATGANATAGTHSITATGGTAMNYAITDVPGTLTVSKAGPLTVTADNQSKVYGAADPTLTYTVTGTLYYADTDSVVSGVSLSTATGAAATAGTHTITASGGIAANYNITDAPGTLTVSQAAPLTVTADNKSKVYGATDPNLTYTVSGTFYYTDGPSVVSGVSLSTATGAAATAGTHTITASGGMAANYGITDADGTLTVSQAPLTVTADNQSKVYGATDPMLTYTVSGPLYYNDTDSVVSGVSLSTVTGGAATAGTHTITAAGGTATNYSITDAPGTLTVAQAPLTVTADNQSKVYGAADPTLTYTVSGPLYYTDTDSVVSGVSLSTATGAAATAGTHTIAAGGGTAANYAITDVPGTLTVSKAAALTVTADNQSKVYGAADPTLTYTVTGTLYYTDTDSVVSGVSLSTATGAAATAGTHTITAGGGTAANYGITDLDGTLSVSQAPLTVTAVAQTKVYGASMPALTYQVSGFAYTDNTGVLTGSPVLTTSATASSGVGTYPISIGAGTLQAANYDFPAADLVNSTLKVTPAALIITANPQTIVAGGAIPVLTASYSGFVNGDSAASLTALPAITTSATSASPAGSYAIVASGAASPNYTISYVSGTLTVNPASGGTAGSHTPITVESASIEKMSAGKGKKHKSAEVIVIQFSGGLNSSSAQNVGNYTLATVAKGKKKKSKPLALGSAAYNASTFAVTLTPGKQPLKPPVQLTLIAAGLVDLSGQAIDGNDDGQPGGNFVATLGGIGASVALAEGSARSAGPASGAVDALLATGFHVGKHHPGL